MIRHALYAIVLLGTQLYLNYLVIHEWLGYPLVPATATNQFITLIGLNVEIAALVFVLFIPTLLVAGAVTFAVSIVVDSVRIVWALRGQF